MNATVLPILLAAQYAAEALIVLGWPVLPVGHELKFWVLGDFIFSDDELLAFALHQGVQLAPDHVQ